jgi:hypothetical protein
MAEAVTREYFDRALDKLAGKEAVEQGFGKVGLRLAELHGAMDAHFGEVNTKLDAIMSLETIATRKQLHALLQALKKKAIEINKAEILAS